MGITLFIWYLDFQKLPLENTCEPDKKPNVNAAGAWSGFEIDVIKVIHFISTQTETM